MKKFRPYLIPALLILLYLATHLYRLTLLPVFADEAIYIRWTQLIMDDWQRYLFFPMMDGKTPLWFWLMWPFQYLFQDQLFAGRFVAVLVGLVQMLSVGYWIKVLGGEKKTQWLGMLLISILPFWYFHHRMALTDGLLVLGMTWAMISVTQLVKSKRKWRWAVLSAIFLGVSLWSKLPALLVFPALPLFVFLDTKSKKPVKSWLENWLYIGGAILGGMILLYTLRVSDAFPRLFVRGSDFLYPWKEVVFNGQWQNTLISIPNYITYFLTYLTWPLMLIVLVGLFSRNKQAQRNHHVLFWSAIAFAAPIAILGRVVYPRYLFPASLFLTVGAALTIEDLIKTYLSAKKFSWKNAVVGGVLALLLANTIILSTDFMTSAVTQPGKMNLVSSDREQYLYVWSSGHGIKESVELIRQLSADKNVAIATEGSFGTMPDGLLLYLHRQNVDNIYLEGIGYPVDSLTDKFVARAEEFDQILFIANEDRLEMDLGEAQLLEEFCRPDGYPCLQVWDITAELPNLPSS